MHIRTLTKSRPAPASDIAYLLDTIAQLLGIVQQVIGIIPGIQALLGKG